METSKTFDKTPCIVELMGHTRYTCLVSEITIAGSGMLRLDWDGEEPWTKCINTSTLYCITPIAHEMYARYKETQKKQDPFNFYISAYVMHGPQIEGPNMEDDELPM